MNSQTQVLFILLLYQVAEVVFDFVYEDDAGFYFPRTFAGRTFFEDLHIGFGSNSLTGNLNKAEFAGRKDVVLGTVLAHFFLHFFIELTSISCLHHIDEVDDDDPAHIAQPELAGDFGSGLQIHIQGVFFLAVFAVHAVTAVDINDVQGFGVLNDQIRSAFDGNDLSKGAFDLFFNAKMFENGEFAFVQLEDVKFSGAIVLM